MSTKMRHLGEITDAEATALWREIIESAVRWSAENGVALSAPSEAGMHDLYFGLAAAIGDGRKGYAHNYRSNQEAIL
jgi:hypothetical protein